MRVSENWRALFLHNVFMDYFLILSMAKVRAGME